MLPKEFEMKEDQLKISIDSKNLVTKFKLKISKFQHFEGYPKLDCQTYTADSTYTNCIEKEIASKFHKSIGCHPP